MNCLIKVDKKQHTAGVCVDLCKVFDTIGHFLPLQKLERYGVRGAIQQFQYVETNRIKSHF